ncbi:ABC transporter permease [Enterococcus sp. AD013-P3]|uniref:ABC transporter permease n=1 Tax=Enterococcus sp. AD013-P3 TaxID=3411036 RepID=UPI003B93C496
MNILNRVSFAYLKKNKTRTLVTIIGVVLSVALVTLVTTLAASFHQLLLNDAIAADGDYTLVYQFKTRTEEKKEQEIRNDKQVAESYLTDIFALTTLPKQYMDNSDVPSFGQLIGVESLGFKKLPFGKLEGNLPVNDHELLVSTDFIEQTGKKLKIGSQLSLPLVTNFETYHSDSSIEEYLAEFKPTLEANYRISGIYQPSQDTETWGRVYKFYTTAEPLKYSHPSSLYLRLKDPGQWQEFKKQHSGKELEDVVVQLNSTVSQLQGNGAETQNNYTNLMLTGTAAVFILLISLGSVLLIHNAFSMSINERLQQFGILSSVGATKKQLCYSVLFEGLVIGGIAIPLGLISGLSLVYIGRSGFLILLRQMNEPELLAVVSKLPIVTSWQVLIVAAIVGFITILLSAWLPARRALRASAITVIRQNDQIHFESKKIRTSWLTTKIFGFSSVLAIKNFKRNRKAYRSTIISLFVSIVLFIGTSSLVMYVENSIQTASPIEESDLSFTAFRGDSQSILEIFKEFDQIPQIKSQGWQASSYVMAEFPEGSLSERSLREKNDSTDEKSQKNPMQMIAILGLDDTTFNSWSQQLGVPTADFYQNDSFVGIANSHLSYYESDQKKIVSYDLLKSTTPLTLALTGFIDEKRTVLNTHLQLSTYTEKEPAMFHTPNKNELYVYLPFSQFERLKESIPEAFHSGNDTTIFNYKILSDDSTTVERSMRRILQAYPSIDGNVVNNVQRDRTNRNMLTATKIFVYSFISIIALIAVANVFNTIATNINLRKRELAMLESVGMGPRAIYKMMCFECLLYGTKALLWGLPVAMVINFIIYKFMTSGVEQAFLVPWQAIAISILLVFIIVFVTMIYAVHKLQKKNIIAGLRSQ